MIQCHSQLITGYFRMFLLKSVDYTFNCQGIVFSHYRISNSVGYSLQALNAVQNIWQCEFTNFQQCFLFRCFCLLCCLLWLLHHFLSLGDRLEKNQINKEFPVSGISTWTNLVPFLHLMSNCMKCLDFSGSVVFICGNMSVLLFLSIQQYNTQNFCGLTNQENSGHDWPVCLKLGTGAHYIMLNILNQLDFVVFRQKTNSHVTLSYLNYADLQQTVRDDKLIVELSE